MDIPDDLIAEARKVVGPKATMAETVRTALEETVRRRRLAETRARLELGAALVEGAVTCAFLTW